MSLQYNKLGKTQIANSLRLISKQYSPEDFLNIIQNHYSNSVVYDVGQLVVYENKIYLSTTDENTNNVPSRDSEYWSLITDENKMLCLWDMNNVYKQNAMVYYNKQLYVSLIDDNINNLPTDTTVWRKFTSSFLWSSSLVYSQGQFVAYGNSLYYSLQNDNYNHRPSDSQQYWQLFSEYGSKIQSLLLELNGTNAIEEKYQISYDFENYKINIVHNLNGRVNGIIYDENDKQAFFGIDYVGPNQISVQMNSQSFPSEEKIWKIGIYLGTGFSVRYVNYDDTTIKQDIIDIQGEISTLKRQIANLQGGMLYVGSVDLSEYRNSSEDTSEENSGE